MLSSFDALLVIAAFVVMICGMRRRCRIWKQGRPQRPDANKRMTKINRVIGYVLGHRKILKNRYGGISHLFVFWGFTLPLAVVIVTQFGITLPKATAGGLSLLLDLAGIFALIGTVIFLHRNLKDKQGRQGKSLIHLWILLAIIVTGFLAEGSRLQIQMMDTVGLYDFIVAPIGSAIAHLMPASPLLLKLLIRIHFFLVLFFIAGIPFTIMRHAIAGTINVYRQEPGPRGAMVPLALEGDYFGVGKTEDFSWNDLLDVDACMSCGLCDKNCPAFNSGQGLSPRGIIRDLCKKMETSYVSPPSDTLGQNKWLYDDADGAVGGEDIWSCTTCLACVENCPVFVGHVDKVLGMRRHAVLTTGRSYPSEYKRVFKNTEIFGDSLGKGSLLREDWASNLKLKRIYQEPEVEILFWVGCMGALYGEKCRKKTAVAARILEKAGINFGILGKEERCCGDAARRMGNEYLFQELARQNIEIFRKYHIKKIVTFCPHGFHVFKNEYPQFGAEFEVLPFIQLVKSLLDDGRLKVTSKIDGVFTYHDPCYLGRYNNLYQTPRDILDAALASNLEEMGLSKNSAFCCGAGGGNFWRGRIVGRRMEESRIEQAIETKANGLITACPFCEIMFDGATQKGHSYSFEVMDILEIVNQVT